MTWKDVATFFIALLIILLFGGVFGLLLLRPITLSEGTSALVNMAFGFLGAAFGAVVTFYFGSSASSQKKDDTISQMVSNAVPVGTTTTTTATAHQNGAN
jgi:hypothetical protein